jgi:choline dehydrogenase-like flavoprotein
MAAAGADCDYVIVGSGAGGGTLAARLAEGGCRVVLLEAGGDPRAAVDPRMPADYDVPAFHAFASENPAISWEFFVRHYADAARQARDPKADSRGVFYPRAAGLGGCTAHNAMILVCPNDADWNDIASLTGDRSWRAANMRRYFRRLEDCHHRPEWRWLGRLFGLNPTGHGWNGWLSTEHARPTGVFHDRVLMQFLLSSAFSVVEEGPRLLEGLWRLFRSQADPNDGRMLRQGREGVCYTPLTTRGHQRTGARERVLDVAARHSDRLKVELHALATHILFDADNRATGIAYRKGAHLYRADPNPSDMPGEMREIRAAQGVILAGGAFNTPQLLMLSGIGPRAELERHGIPVRVDLPGVGRNLQDRYEIGIVNRMTEPWQVLRGASFDTTDPLYREWADHRSGMYMANGTALAVVRRSDPRRPLPDLFCMGLLAKFTGYYPGYSREIAAHSDYFTWAVLKAHTNNRAGAITLRSADPRDPPQVDFHYFEEGSDQSGDDLRAVVSAIRFVRTMTDELRRDGIIAAEELPGDDCQTDEQLADYVRDNAWGHHASCSCPIGPRAAGGVVDSAFSVHGTTNLRIVDASVFPRIPGYFIASAVYTIAEKAADVILRDHARAA